MADQFEFSSISSTAITIAKDCMAAVLESKRYNPTKTAEWIDSIGGNVVANLRDVSPNFKYIVSGIITQKTGAGFHYDVQSFWDATTDGAVTATFENETMTCICTVIGVAI